MVTDKRVFDIDGDLLVQRYKQGIILTKPHKQAEWASNTVSSIYALPITSYFLGHGSRIIHSNDASLEIIGAQSLTDIIGKTVEAFTRKQSCVKVLENDSEIMRTELMKVTDETAETADNFSIQTLSFKFPWYYEKKVIGVFGFSIKTGLISLSDFANIFAQLMTTGLLNSAQFTPNTSSFNAKQNDIYLSQREKEVLSYVIRGKTAKEIARRLAISRRTVEHHIAAIKQKTNSSFKSDLIDKFT